MKKYIQILLIITIIIGSCKPKPILTLDEILSKYQWRKTEKAIYNTNNELEDYLFTFEDAEDCEKNSYHIYSGRKQGEYRIFNLCRNGYYISYEFFIKNDTIILKPFKSDTVSKFYSKKHINYYDEKTYILDYDTTINDVNKKIKETFTAYPKY